MALVRYPISKLLYNEYHFNSRIYRPIRVTPKSISLGHNVFVYSHGRIQGIQKYNDKSFFPHIILHDGVSIQQNCHITCANRIEIGKNTAIAAGVTITDIHHPYLDVNIPIEKQDIQVKEVVVGCDCKIYNGAVILPGVTIGKHVTIGANSIVSHDIPDYSVAAGIPAKIIKKYNFDTQKWESL